MQVFISNPGLLRAGASYGWFVDSPTLRASMRICPKLPFPGNTMDISKPSIVDYALILAAFSVATFTVMKGLMI